MKKFNISRNTLRKFAIGDDVKIFWDGDQKYYKAQILDWHHNKALVKYEADGVVSLEKASNLKTFKEGGM